MFSVPINHVSEDFVLDEQRQLCSMSITARRHILDLPPYKIFAATFEKYLDLCRGFSEMILIPPIVHAIIV